MRPISVFFPNLPTEFHRKRDAARNALGEALGLGLGRWVRCSGCSCVRKSAARGRGWDSRACHRLRAPAVGRQSDSLPFFTLTIPTAPLCPAPGAIFHKIIAARRANGTKEDDILQASDFFGGGEGWRRVGCRRRW